MRGYIQAKNRNHKIDKQKHIKVKKIKIASNLIYILVYILVVFGEKTMYIFLIKWHDTIYNFLFLLNNTLGLL